MSAGAEFVILILTIEHFEGSKRPLKSIQFFLSYKLMSSSNLQDFTLQTHILNLPDECGR